MHIDHATRAECRDARWRGVSYLDTVGASRVGSSGVVAGFARVFARALHGSPQPLVVSRHLPTISLSSYLTRFRAVGRVTSAQHLLRQRLVPRQHLGARIVIYDRHSGRCELGFAGRPVLEIWHG